jgi:hypothetical protein
MYNPNIGIYSSKGGAKRAESLSKEDRSRIAKAAAHKRWDFQHCATCGVYRVKHAEQMARQLRGHTFVVKKEVK